MRAETVDRNKKIYEGYLSQKDVEKDMDKILVFLANTFNVNKFYIRGILKTHGIDMGRKRNYDRKDGQVLSDRNSNIMTMYNEGKELDEIGTAFDISETRVRQILKECLRNKVVDAPQIESPENATYKDLKRTRIVSNFFDSIKADVKSGMSNADIIEKYGASVIRQIKNIKKYNIFKETVRVFNNKLISMYRAGKTVEQISEKLVVSKDYAYSILHENGISGHPGTRDRNKRIIQLYRNKSAEYIAKALDLRKKLVERVLQKKRDEIAETPPKRRSKSAKQFMRKISRT